MAKRYVLVDDLTGKEIEEGKGGTVAFSLRGEHFQIDLSEESQAKLDKILQPYLQAATPAEAPHPSLPPARKAAKAAKRAAPAPDEMSKEQRDAIRNWANANGYTVGDRGRIKAEIIEAFEAAHRR